MMQFDTHKAYKRFKDAGIEDKAADAFVEAINDARATDLENLTTKHDLSEVKSELGKEIAEVKSELMKEINVVREGVFEAKLQAAKFHSELKEQISALNHRFNIVYIFGSALFALLSAVAVKIFFG